MNSFERADFYIRKVNARNKVQKRRDWLNFALNLAIFTAFVLLALSLAGM